jgi:hypothetical protein
MMAGRKKMKRVLLITTFTTLRLAPHRTASQPPRNRIATASQLPRNRIATAALSPASDMAICAYIFPADHSKAGRRCGKQAGNNKYCSIETHNGSAHAATGAELVPTAGTSNDQAVFMIENQAAGDDVMEVDPRRLYDEAMLAVHIKHQELQADRAQAQQQIHAEEERLKMEGVRLAQGFQELEQLKQEEQARAWAAPGAGPAASSFHEASAAAAKQTSDINACLIAQIERSANTKRRAHRVFDAVIESNQGVLDALVAVREGGDESESLIDNMLQQLRIG